MGGCWTSIRHNEVLRPPDKKRCRAYSEGKLHSKGGAESEPGSSVVTGWMAVPSVEGEGGSDEVTWGAVTCVLSVGPLSGVPICSWLFPCVLVILHSFPLRSALCLSLPCLGHPKAGICGLPRLVSVPWGDDFPLLLEPGRISIPCWLHEPCTHIPKELFPQTLLR